ncbi:MAG: class I SAM-dependent RNA methyltransferase [Kiritimatiellia bacterium]
MTSGVYIAKNVYGGDGMGKLGDGRVVFVPGALAGESVKAEIVEEKRHFVKARLVEVVEASPARLSAAEIAADLPDGPMPGMVYAGVSYQGECAAKVQQLREFFDRARIPIPPIRQTANQAVYHYRNKVVYHFARQQGKWVLGYRQEPSHAILDVTADPLARPEINAKLPEIRTSVMALLTQGAEAVRRAVARQANVTVRWTAKSGVQWWLGDAPQGQGLREVTCGKVFEVPCDGFYQVNPEVGEALAKAVVSEFRTAPTAELLDLYCGVGVFGLCCAEGTVKVTGIESGRQAVDFARRNAAAQGAATARFFVDRVGRALRRLCADARTTVIVDPPRGGLEPDVPQALADSSAPRIMYVSCDPATLMRDLRTICRNYDVESVRWFNMFPRTARFETLVVLRRR